MTDVRGVEYDASQYEATSKWFESAMTLARMFYPYDPMAAMQLACSAAEATAALMLCDVVIQHIQMRGTER